jgi:hypothetical protein
MTHNSARPSIPRLLKRTVLLLWVFSSNPPQSPLSASCAWMLSVGLLSGGNGGDELFRAGAFRVFRDASELHKYLDELGVLS